MTADSFAKVLAAATLLAVAPSLSAAQDFHCDSGDVEVRGLDFVGNKTFSDAELGNVIVTTPSAWGRRYFDLPFSAKRCLDRTEFVNDRLRLILFYRRHGFPGIAVDTALTPNGVGGAQVRFLITEGAPTMLRSLVIAGLDSVAHKSAILHGLPIRAGQRFDRVRIDAVIDTITHRLRNSGYPAAAANNLYTTYQATTGQVADDSLIVTTGAFTRVGAVEIDVQPPPGKKAQQIPNRVVQQLVNIDSGSVYQEQRLVDAQRKLYEANAYRHVSVALDSTNGTMVGNDSVAPLDVSLVENTMHAARVGLGYGTLDCFRATGELDDYNFLQGAKLLQLQGRVSKIGIGKPLSGASQLCPQAQHDPYSTRLNYYLGATLQQPVFFGLHTAPTITAFTQRVSEYNAYVRTTSIGGVASVVARQSTRTPITFSYTVDYGRTEAQPALFCAVFDLCTLEDRERVQSNQRLAVASIAVAHDGSNNTASPTEGTVSRFEVRHASPLVLSDPELQFNTLIGDLAHYFSLWNGGVLALHVRSGTVFGKSFSTNSGFIPPQERMYGGGPTSVRGFRQNELGAITYIAVGYDTVHTTVNGVEQTYFRLNDSTHIYSRAVPVGGNSLLVGNIELRLRSPLLPDVLQFALFTDAGDVWNRGDGDVQAFSWKVTPGVQMAALTPVGPVRLVVGYNPYRQPAGPIYYENTAAQGGSLPCVSPTNTLPVTTSSSGGLLQAEGSCPSSFQPAANTSFRSRLTFSLAIGQAF